MFNFIVIESTTEAITRSDGGKLRTENAVLEIGPGCLLEDTVITMIQYNQNSPLQHLADRELVDNVPVVLELLPDGLKFFEPGADMTVLIPEGDPSLKLFVFYGSRENESKKITWQFVDDEHVVKVEIGTVQIKVHHFCFFGIFRSRKSEAHAISFCNHSYNCHAVGLYRRIPSFPNLEIAVVLYTEFVKREECQIQNLISNREDPYIVGEKGPIKRLDTNQPLKVFLDFPGTNVEPVKVDVDEDQLDRFGMVVDDLPEIPNVCPTSGMIMIHACAENEKLVWKMHIREVSLSMNK